MSQPKLLQRDSKVTQNSKLLVNSGVVYEAFGNIVLTGDISGNGSFNSDGNVTINTSISDLNYLPLTGGTMTGSIVLDGQTTTISKNGSSSNWINGRDKALLKLTTYDAYSALTSMKTSNGAWEMGVYTDDAMYFTYTPDSNYSTGTNEGYKQIKLVSSGGLYGAVWNDYAEFRDQKEPIEPGYCVISQDDGKVSLTTEKMQACDGIVSDTFGFAIGETEKCQTPLAVAGRVLAYCEGDRYSYHAGDTVCAGPGGKVCKMTRDEICKWPDRIVGIVSEIPEYKTWGSGNVEVNNRIWIRVK